MQGLALSCGRDVILQHVTALHVDGGMDIASNMLHRYMLRITSCHRSVHQPLMVVYIDIVSNMLHPFYVTCYNMSTPVRTAPTVDGSMDLASNMLPGYEVTMSSVTTSHRECVRQTAKR